jgi:hypothetical protein
MGNKKKEAKKMTVSMIMLITFISIITLSVIVVGILQYAHVINIFGSPQAPVELSTSSQPKLVNNGSSAQTGKYTPPGVTVHTLFLNDSICSELSFPSGTAGSVGSWIYEESVDKKKTTFTEAEQKNIIMQAQIYIGSTVEAESAPVKLGQYITKVTLSKDIAPGSYSAQVQVNYFYADTQHYITTMSYKDATFVVS